mgnify:CR=1 FL=1
MITKDEIKKLADLARIEVSDSEAEGLTSQIDSILGYVGQIQDMNSGDIIDIPKVRNIMRDDVITYSGDEYTERLLSNAPEREGRYFKVKKIL